MRFSTASAWLEWINQLHPSSIDLGLERVRQVAARLDLLHPLCPVITVAGTNGKGSTVAALASIYLAAGKKVGTFTSPFLWRINEQIQINGKDCTDQELCDAFAKVAAALQEVTLTSFEYITLAACLILQSHSLDVWILEVGLGGRLDAVNIISADLAIITSIGLDHTQWLGDTREKIGCEKAGIFRAEQLAIYADPLPPHSVLAQAEKLTTKLYCLNRDYHYDDKLSCLNWSGLGITLENLPRNSLYQQNMAAVIMAIQLLQFILPVKNNELAVGLRKAMIPGRMQIVMGEVMEIYDVAHNPDSVKLLSQRLAELPGSGRTIAVFSMLADKDILSSIKIISPFIDQWFIAPLDIQRGASEKMLREMFSLLSNTEFHATIPEAYVAAKKMAETGDRIVIFGSFHTVAALLKSLHSFHHS